jgi:hypothetical protein
MRSIHCLGAVLAALGLLTACGGGGGDAPPAAAQVSIGASNQSNVARSAFAGTFALGDAQGTLSSDDRANALSASSPEATQAQAAVVKVARRALAQALPQRAVAQSAMRRPQAVTSEPYGCNVSGTGNVTFDDRDNSLELSTGDVLTISFSQCRDDATAVINGALTLTLTSLTTGPSQTLIGATLAFQQISVVAGAESTTINGTVNATMTSTLASMRVVLTTGSAGLSATVSSPSYSDAIAYAPGFTIDSTETFSPAEVVTIVNGGFSSTVIGGSVTVSTPQAIRHVVGNVYPSSGRVLVVGAGGTQLRITVLSTSQVQLELDADGNGSFEASSVVAWSTLLG